MRNLLLAALLALPAPAGAGLSPAAQSQAEESLRRLYDLDYEACRSSVRQIIEAEPDNPFGYLFEAAAIWWQGSAEYGIFQDTPTLQGLFEQDIEAALRKSKPLFRAKDPEVRADAYFASGMALGTKGQWDLLRGRYLQAYFAGKKAVKHLKKCLKIDKNHADAYLGLGIYDYQAGRLPGALKLSYLLGVRGDVKRGLERIELAAREGRYGSRQAAQFLASIYISDEHDFARALPIIQRLRQDFPRSPYFQFLELYLRHRLGDWDGSYREAAALFARLQADPAALRRKLLSLACGLAGDKCLSPELARQTLPWFEHALEISAQEGTDPWSTFLRLCRGQAADAAGERAMAVADYKWVLGQPDVCGLKARARECLEKPCRQEETLLFLRALARDHSGPLPPAPPAGEKEDGSPDD